MLPFNKPFIVGKELFYIAEAVIKMHLSGDGLFTKKCHQLLEQKLQCNKVFLTHSCTAALEMAAILCDIKAGDEVILPSYTFVSTANAFVLRGATPVFIDIRKDTLNIDEKLIEAAITPKTKAIIPVHYAGVSCNMKAIMAIAEKYNLFVIEDAAQAILSQTNGKYLGTIGHLGCLSFHETKNIISGEGGALLINDKEFIQRAEIIREKGTNRGQFFRGERNKYTWVDIGSSYLPSELVAAFLYAQLEHAEHIISIRKNLWQTYYNQFCNLESQNYIQRPQTLDNNGHIFYIILPNLEIRQRLISYLKDYNIHTVFHYIPLHSSPAGQQYGRISNNMDITDKVADCLLRLPLFYKMTNKDISFVVNKITDFFTE